jgi:hypothetical protein
MDVPGKLGGILIGFDEDGLVPSLKQVPGPSPFEFDIEISCIRSANVSHDLRKVTTAGVSRKRW